MSKIIFKWMMKLISSAFLLLAAAAPVQGQTSQSQYVMGRLFATSVQHSFFQHFIVSQTHTNLDASGKSYQKETTLSFPEMSCFPYEKYCQVHFNDKTIALYQQAKQWKPLMLAAKSARPEDLRCTSYDEQPTTGTKITCRIVTESFLNGLRDLPAPTSFFGLQLKETEIVRFVSTWDAPERERESRYKFYELTFSL